tara:strand:- start:62 stop:343 length:282 start_codon:yes stop_codon:yes gene_type:complete
MKLPWNSSSNDQNNKDNKSNIDSIKKSTKILEFKGKRYDLELLSLKIQKLLDTLQIAENQYKTNLNKLQLIKLSKESLIKQIENELIGITEIN